MQVRLIRRVFSNANDINLFLTIFPCRHEPPLQASPSAQPRIQTWLTVYFARGKLWSQTHFKGDMTGLDFLEEHNLGEDHRRFVRFLVQQDT